MSKIATEKGRHHSLSLRYLCRWTLARLLRVLIRIQLFFDPFPRFKNPNVTRTEGRIPSRDEGRYIRVRWYRPTSAAPDEALPVLVNFHGSGFLLPLFGQDEGWCASVAEKARMLVIDADYRKAPEYPFPFASEDGEDVVRHILANIPHTTVSLSGFSAGGSVAFGLTSVLGHHIHSVVSFYPSVDTAADEVAQTDDPVLPPVLLRFLFSCYLVAGTVRSNPRLSATFVPTQDMPPHVWISAGSIDPLHDSGHAFVSRLQREGHPDAVFVSVPGKPHGFDRSGAAKVTLSPLGQEKHDEAIAFLKKALKA
ncbi:Alpha/Beta hydrolase protein [Roridomyces roridus]|uniref:Alpha/Beta hydrolase protein n=1 Tax=Roridomyces roridus TaxID=1738132 RepID=A0AAD7BH25_9AGAR|nr:Alpha/Beta hydrolase protein [Roridomyces roridus]